MWNGTKVKPLGSCTLPVINPKNGEKYQLKSRELHGTAGFTCGRTFHSENFVNAVKKSDDDPVIKHPDVCYAKLGAQPGKVHLQVDSNCKPVVLSAKKIAVAIRAQE